jgi:hypothetical protein
VSITAEYPTPRLRRSSGQFLMGVAAALAPSAAAGPTAKRVSIEIIADLQAGDLRKLRAVVRDAAGRELRDRPVAWACGDQGVATVTETGVLIARRAGTVEVVARTDGAEARATLAIAAPDRAALAPTTYRVGRPG